MSPSENMETFDTERVALSAGAWKAWADSRSARATTAADFIGLVVLRTTVGEGSERPCGTIAARAAARALMGRRAGGGPPGHCIAGDRR